PPRSIRTRSGNAPASFSANASTKAFMSVVSARSEAASRSNVGASTGRKPTDHQATTTSLGWSYMLARRLLRLGVLVALVVAGAGLAGCGAAGKSAATTSASPGSASAARDRWGTVWLCRPGVGGDPCVSDLATSVVTRSGAVRVEPVSPARTAAVDCFYVYPTISDQRTINANLTVGFRERAVAVAQAARFSQVCRVY